MVSEGDNGSKYVYDYTSLSQLRYVRSDVSATLEDGTAVGVWYTYDELGRLATTSAALQGSNPVGETIVAADFRNEYTYSNDGHLVSISQAGVSGVGNNTVTTKAVEFSWDQLGRLSQIDRSMVWSGNLLPYLRTTFDYDEAGALSGLTQIHVNATTTPSYSEILTTLHTYSWDYDDAGRLETATTPDGTTDYTYDDTDQLTGVDSSYQPDEAYTYDENGNRTNSGYVTGDYNRVLSDGTYNYTYDAEGNRTSRTKISDGSYVSYTWDYRQRLTEVTFKTSVSGSITKQVAYTYDTQNRLLVKQLDSTGNGTFEVVERYAYDGANVVLQLDDTDTVEHRYLQGQGIDQLFADENAVNDVLWALTDNQGTVRDWVEFNTPSVAPTVVEHLQYDAFGQITDDSNPSLDTRYAYTGREWDADAELYYYRARWYDPAVGSFVSEDPLRFNAGDNNLRRYVGNSPTNATDPTGQKIDSRTVGGTGYFHIYTPQQWTEGGELLATVSYKLGGSNSDIERDLAYALAQRIDGARTSRQLGNIIQDGIQHGADMGIRVAFQPVDLVISAGELIHEPSPRTALGVLPFVPTSVNALSDIQSVAAKSKKKPPTPSGRPAPAPVMKPNTAATAESRARPSVKCVPPVATHSGAAAKGYPGIKITLFDSPDFAGTKYLRPVAGTTQKNIVRIKMTGSRYQDFKEANRLAGFPGASAPDGYTWHHLADYNPFTNTTTMQLVESRAHEATYPHKGSVFQYEQYHGVDYK